MKNVILSMVLLALSCTTVVVADEKATCAGPQSVAETVFVSTIQRDLMRRFPTVADAENAGYVRYTGIDDTGAISYANLRWTSDPKHPSQLWYDRNGQLLGADFSAPFPANRARPQLWGVSPGRWIAFPAHVHWVTRNATSGTMTYDLWITDDDFKAAGGDVEHPSPATLVAMHKVASAGDVVTIFNYPEVWDLVVWVKTNPNGAFAEKNPTVSLEQP